MSAKKAAAGESVNEHVAPLAERRLQQREERRRRMAERAVREYHRRMKEMGNAAERMGIDREEARRMFEGARDARASLLRELHEEPRRDEEEDPRA